MPFDVTLRNPNTGFNILLNDPPSGPATSPVKVRNVYAIGNIYKFRR